MNFGFDISSVKISIVTKAIFKIWAILTIKLKTKPTLNKLRMGKNCYEKEKLPLTLISDIQI